MMSYGLSWYEKKLGAEIIYLSDNYRTDYEIFRSNLKSPQYYQKNIENLEKWILQIISRNSGKEHSAQILEILHSSNMITDFAINLKRDLNSFSCILLDELFRYVFNYYVFGNIDSVDENISDFRSNDPESGNIYKIRLNKCNSPITYLK